MMATKFFLAIVGVSIVVMGWVIAHSMFWDWMLPDSSWAPVGALLTAIVLPGLIGALLYDWLATRNPTHKDERA